MLLLLLYYVIVTMVCTALGIFFYGVFEKEASRNKPIIFYPITGLIIIALIAQIIALFFPVNYYISLGFIVFLIIITIFNRKKNSHISNAIITYVRNLPILSFLLITACGLMIFTFNSGPSMMDDTESYHIQMIKWVHEYGTVPGIANLHERFGFNSSWFSVISFFLPTNQFNFYTALNGLISFWLSAYLITCFSFSSNKGLAQVSTVSIASFFVFALSILCWPMTRGNATTANYDFITTFLIVVLFLETIKLQLQNQKFTFTIEWFIWPVYLFTVRIINFPLLLLSLVAVCLLLKQKNYRQVLFCMILSLGLVLPFLARNILLSGYPFYPSEQFNFFNVDWKVDDDIITGLLSYIKYFNRVNNMFMPIHETEQLPFPAWVGPWFHYLFRYDKIVVIPGLIGLFASIGFFKRFRTYAWVIPFFIVVLILQILSWFFIAPDPRFVYGPLLCGSFLLIVALLKIKTYSFNKTFVNCAFIPLTICIFFYSGFKIARDKNYQNFVWPMHLPSPPVKKVTLDDIDLHIPEKILSNWNPRCYGTALPCLYIINPKLRARGTAIKDGFRLEK